MPFDILSLVAAAPDAVERLLDEAFGADRRGRTAYRLREGATPVAALSFSMTDGAGRLAAVLQSWPVMLRGDGREPTPLVLVGPVAVAPERQGQGLGRALMARLLARAAAHPPLVLVGDPEYYGRFGFSAEATGGWELPGPFERHRLLALTGGRTLPAAGLLGPHASPSSRA